MLSDCYLDFNKRIGTVLPSDKRTNSDAPIILYRSASSTQGSIIPSSSSLVSSPNLAEIIVSYSGGRITVSVA